MRTLILPGWHGSGPEHWQSHWQSREPSALRVEQDDWDQPRLEPWLQRLDAAVRENPGALLVAHSLGVILVAHYASRFPDAAVGAALLVAPGDADLHGPHEPAIASFAPVPRAPLPFASTMVLSRNDPHMAFERGQSLARDLGCTIIDLGDAGHINPDSGYGPWPHGHDLADALRQHHAQG